LAPFWLAPLRTGSSLRQTTRKQTRATRIRTRPPPGQQKMNTVDQYITKQIRSSIMKDKSLSTYALNIKIITQSGMVTLKGPVRSEDEKSAVEAKAQKIAGASNVTSELTVAPPKR
jgi:hyperosmotically inducible periplasmic protein